MAEFLALVGAISNFASIGEFCLGLVEKARDVKNAPRDVERLVNELSVLGKSAIMVETIVKDPNNTGLRSKIDEAVQEALDECTKIARELHETLAKSEEILKRAGARSWWERVRVSQGKKGILKLLGRIERAKTTLLVAQQAALNIAEASYEQLHDGRFKTLSQAIELMQTDHRQFSTITEKKMDNSIRTVSEALNATRSNEHRINEMTNIQMETLDNQKQMNGHMLQVSDLQAQNIHGISETLGGIKAIENNISAKIDSTFNQGQDLLTVTREIGHEFAEFNSRHKQDTEVLRSTKRAVEELTAMICRPGAIGGLLALAQPSIQTSKCPEAEIVPDSSNETQVARVNDSCNQHLEGLSSKRSQRIRNSYKSYINKSYFSVDSYTEKCEINKSDQKCASASHTKFTTYITIRTPLRFLTGEFSYIRGTTAWDPLYENKVRFVEIFSDDSDIWRACTALDLNEVRRLFDSRQASPFMENQYGQSLLEQYIDYKTADIEPLVIDADAMVGLFELVFEARGRGGIGIRPFFFTQLVGPCKDKVKSDGYDRIIRQILEKATENPLEYHTLPAYFDDFCKTIPHITSIILQSSWSLASLALMSEDRVVVEGATQMLSDPNGKYLKNTLEDARMYFVVGKTTNPGDPMGSSLRQLLEMIANTPPSKTELRECCKNRIRLFLSTPQFSKFLRDIEMEFSYTKDLTYAMSYDTHAMYLGRYAIRKRLRPLLEDIFSEIGWRSFDIDDFFDKETYYCVSDLVDGRIAHQTARQIEREFIIDVCGGAFIQYNLLALGNPAYHLTWPAHCPKRMQEAYSSIVGINLEWYSNFYGFITAANQAFKARATPGSWPEEDRSLLVPEVDFRLEISHKIWGPRVKKLFLWWYHHATEHGADEECRCEEWYDCNDADID